MDLKGKQLIDWFLKQPATSFPSDEDYATRFKAMAEELNQRIHSEVNRGNMSKDGGYLTDHGPNHIRAVIDRISRLVESRNCKLTPYEAFFLLTAAHFHDVGNIFGRAEHESTSQVVIRDLETLVGIDAVERRYIWTIAQAHGGAEKDKLGALPFSEEVKGRPVRLQLLAAILKFADELAEEPARAARYALMKGLLPEQSKIFHAYATTVQSTVVDHSAKEVRLKFYLTDAMLTLEYELPSKRKVLLVDYILERTLKTHWERTYCARFMRPDINLDQISVTIAIGSEKSMDSLAKIGYRLGEVGYPDHDRRTIHEICPQLREPSLANWEKRGHLTGASLLSYINSKTDVSHVA